MVATVESYDLGRLSGLAAHPGGLEVISPMAAKAFDEKGIPPPTRQPRADARRNRARVLEVASGTFAAEGLSVPIHEIARRAGVGIGTVSRHFPTKEDLFAAILLDRMAAIVADADLVATKSGPAQAFLLLFRRVVREGAAHRGLAEALAGTAYDLEAAAAEAGCDVSGRLHNLLRQAQAVGSIRPDLDDADVKALMAGCLARASDGDTEALDRFVDLVTDSMRLRRQRGRASK